MDKILLFMFDGMTDYEITLICHLLHRDAGKKVITVAYENKIVKGSSGIMYKPQKLVKDILTDEVAGLIIPGGWYGDFREEMLQLIRKVYNDKKLVAGICGAGTVFLAKAGILDEVKYTTPIVKWTEEYEDKFGGKDPFKRENYTSQRAIRDKNVITAVGPAFVDFAVEICDWFNLFEDKSDKDNFIRNIKGL